MSSLGYHGRPVLKPSVWGWGIPLYLFVGGITGSSGFLALFGRIGGAPPSLPAVALGVALGGAIVSAGLLVADLGRPVRFLNMLRVFKWRSPMSVGVWLLTSYGGLVTIAFLLDILHGPALVETLVMVPAAILGSLVCTYTGVLVAVTAVPAWFHHRRLLPVHFGAAAIGSGASVLQLAGFVLPSLRAIGVVAAVVEIGVAIAIEARRDVIGRALHRGRAAVLLRGAAVLCGPAALGAWLLDRPIAASILFLVGALGSRFGWMEAGRASASDPAAALIGGPREGEGTVAAGVPERAK